ncbi:MAG: SGNH/GDSL hydrolase family protein [Lachnospiraceae bacterium]|nr:SGNH/GDSL hydrolase family protein [Lachnospiraceae bacterium]
MSEETRGPVAPKDPTAKRPFYYIMRNKEVCGSPQKDGRGIQFIYESDGRLGASAKLVGNLEDESMIADLDTVSGLRKQVHSIGVSVQKAGEPVNVKFAFQMYGKTDPYVTGTTLEMELPSDGMEMVMELSRFDWSEDDNVPGQIRFEFPQAGMQAKVTVAFYLNDGFTAPEQTEDRSIDFEGEKYKEMIADSLVQTGNVHRLKSAIERARRGEEVTVGYIGGSITQGAGAIPINTECYAYKSFKGFCDLAGCGYDSNVRYIKAGVGGTPSELGMLRYERDVTDFGKYDPDVMIVEFAVNDEGDETKGECYDSLVRKLYNSPQKPAVILLFSVFVDGYNLEERLSRVGESYHLPMVSTKRSVYDRFYLSEEEGGVVSKNQFFYDMYHPTNTGHTIMADGLIHLFKTADLMPDEPEFDITGINPPKGGEFEKVYFVDRANIDKTPAVISYSVGDFTGHSNELQFVERNLDLQGTGEFPENWLYNGENKETDKPQGASGESSFKARIKCSALLIAYMDSASIEVGSAEVFIDGEKKLDIDPHIVGWQHCNALIAFRGGPSKEREIEIRIPDKDRGKRFTLLGFGIVD